jgi:hypothetical protein
LFEDRCGEGVGEDKMTSRRIRERAHFKETDLIESARENIDDMTIDSSPLGKSFIVLLLAGMKGD